MEAEDEVIAAPEKDHAVVQMIGVKYGEAHHQRALWLI
jgi:hypothetical protein